MNPCIWVATDEPRAIKGRHKDADDHDIECRGCLPCPDDHCIVCGITHVDERTCPTCVGDARDNIINVRNLYAQLPDQALHGGGEGRLEAARPIPGGEAMVLMAPGSTGSALAWSAERGDDTSHRSDERKGEMAPPEMAMVTWEDDWRSMRGQPTGHTATMAGACDYLNEHLSWAAQHHDAFDAFAEEVRAQVSQLENVLHAGVREDTGAPCMRCRKLLVKVWGAGDEPDRWHCTRCNQWANAEQYALAVKAAHMAEAGALSATDMLQQYRINPGTLRSWVSRDKVRKRGKDASGRQLYDVADALTMRDSVEVA